MQEAFNFILEKGTFAGIQIAFFYEQGTVSSDKGSIWKNMKDSYGAGTRLLFNNVIVRIDRGFGREGGQTTFFCRLSILIISWLIPVFMDSEKIFDHH